MTHVSRPRPRVTALLAAALLALVSLVALPPEQARAAEAKIKVQDQTITMSDGVRLNVHVAQPVSGGPYPLVVMPGTFAGDAIRTDFIGDAWAKTGYVTINYVVRGLGSSGGLIEGGGPRDLADARELIDWGLANTPADRDRVGMGGLSYGGGISVLAAAFDPRIKAVANISGWVDLANALYQNNTRAQTTLAALQLVSTLFGRLSPEARAAIQAGFDGKDIEPALEWARSHSAAAYLDRYRQHAPALFMSHSMNETLAPIDSTMRFFNAYPGPKHEDLRAGDHGVQETLVPLAIMPETFKEAKRWLDAWLLGKDDGIATQPAFHVVPRSSGGARPAEDHATIAPARTERRYLASAGGLLRDRFTLERFPGRGSKELREGVNLLLHVPVPEFWYTIEVVTGRPAVATPLSWIDRNVTGVWVGGRSLPTVKYRGEARAHLEITPTARTGTVTVYFLDVDLTDTAYVIAQVPYTFRNATPGKPLTVDVAAPYNAYDLTEGHATGVAISTGDPTYANENPAGSTMRIGPGSYVDLPLK